jgi:predicted nucleic acid-binding protein
MDVLVDSNVILDVLTEDPTWFSWSSDRLAYQADTNRLIINPIIYAEVSIRFGTIEELEKVLDPLVFRKEPILWEAAFLAGKVFLKYKRRGGLRRTPLPDFFIGRMLSLQAYPF